MPKYRVLERSFINNTTFDEGAVIDYDGPVADNLELIEEPKARRGKAKDDEPVAVEPTGDDLV